MNCRMPALKLAFEAADFGNVTTFLSSGNVAFDARKSSIAALERKIEDALRRKLGKTFMTVVRPVDELREMIESDPYRGTRLPAGSKRIVTFLRAAPKGGLDLPIERDGARLLRLEGDTLFGAYVRSDKGPVFMALIEKAVGKEQTTRTWQTVERVAGDP